MKLTRAEKEARLRKAADELIERLLEWEEENKAPNLTQIEDEVLMLRRRFGEELVAVVIAGQEAQQPTKNPKCEKCGVEMRYKGGKERTLESRVGELAIERGYFYCACCKAGFFPLDRQFELSERVWSEGLEREAAFLSGAVHSFEMAKAILKRIGQIDISQSSIWRCAQEAGEKFGRVEKAEQERANALPEQWEPPSRAEVADQRMGVSMDGVSIHIRKEGWKDMKIGVVFDIEMKSTKDKETGEVVDLAHAVNNSYVAHLGGPDVVGEKTWAMVRRQGWEQAQETIVLGDGAPWIWNQAALHFGESHQVVDWYHAKEHLVAAARLIKQDGTSAFTRWLNSRETLLYQGHADKIADELEKTALTGAANAEQLITAAGYFRTNHHRMNYIEIREQEWPIGSGVVESGAKQFKARFGGPGMRWSRQGAENLLPIRSAVLSHRFDQMWATAKILPPS